MRTYRYHWCSDQHPTHHALARCIFGEDALISGDGPFAAISRCQAKHTAVSLWPTLDEAEDARSVRLESWGGCGIGCYRNHETATLHLPTPTQGDPR